MFNANSNFYILEEARLIGVLLFNNKWFSEFHNQIMLSSLLWDNLGWPGLFLLKCNVILNSYYFYVHTLSFYNCMTLNLQSTLPKTNLWEPHKSLRFYRRNSSYSFVHICMFGIKGNEGWKYHDCIMHGGNEKGREKIGKFMTSFWSNWQAGIKGQYNKISQEWQLRPFPLRRMI